VRRFYNVSNRYLTTDVASDDELATGTQIATTRSRKEFFGMKKAIVTTLLASGLMFAAADDKATTQPKLSGNEREALATQSPRIHTGKKHRSKHAQDRVVKDKTTINAYKEPKTNK
jgi:hypothetical protein